MLELLLFRTRSHAETTDGVLELEGGPFCHTAERTPVRLPKGEYEVRVKSATNGEVRLLLYREGGTRAVGCLRAGNGACTLGRGEVVVGLHRARGLCIRSRPCFEALAARIADEIGLTVLRVVD